MPDILTPTLGESVSEATVARWTKKPGEAVKKDEVLVELETDKVSLEVVAQEDGVLSEIAFDEGATVTPGAVLGRIGRTTFPAGTEFFSTEPPVQSKTPIGAVFSQGYGLMTVALWVTYFMGLLVIYLLTGWLPTLIKDAGLPISSAATITAMFQIGGTVGAILVGWAMDRQAPTRVIAAAYAAGAVCILVLGAGGALSGSLAIMVAAAGFFMSGAQTGLNAFAPNCYPTMARATGVSWMLGMGRFGSIVGSMVGGLLLSMGWGFNAIVSLLAIPAVLAALAVLKSRRETPALNPQLST